MTAPKRKRAPGGGRPRTVGGIKVIEESEVGAYLGVFGSLTDGSWKVYCPAEPDGAPQY